MATNKNTIKSAILDSMSSNGLDNNLNSEQSKNKFADDLATIIQNAIKSADVKILPTELVTKVTSSAPGSPVVCTQNLSGSLE